MYLLTGFPPTASIHLCGSHENRPHRAPATSGRPQLPYDTHLNVCGLQAC